ncbi:uncharacterized protein A4U43_C07F36650 [Asparagus officinalis]|uniref:K Homology domain-containing protein n=1 Tax=Asparagus officinalis TaxID=4686 RepID=A0A5P1EHY8_ASPOF|nr:KH domain-containing protein At4g18375-like [Asparagus officinalis]XP_020275090.1 KH domain-containing protein At4g18375-like [Asparagus officinalis]ONK65394.1 uncharacterized protein A4U43_C07F36650 [Asparagus officinalis]
MVDTGKRSRQRDGDRESKNQKRRSGDRESSGEGELILYRILCPDAVIGSVIGKGGKVINSLRQDTNARIKVVDPFPGAKKRVINISCHDKHRDPMFDINEDLDDLVPLCAAQDALLKVHEAILNALANTEDSSRDNKEEAEILLPSSQASTVIGKSGVIIKKMRAKTGANIKVIPKDSSNATHSCALSFDNFLQISGDAEAVKNALFCVSAVMYNFPHKEDISLDTTVPQLPSNVIIPADVPIYTAGDFFPSIAPHGSVPTIPHPSELHGYNNASGAWPVYPSALPVVSSYGVSERSGELVIRVLCPSDKIGRVIGKGGSVVRNIRQASGARVDVDDTKNKSEECLITVTSKESTNDEKSAAVEAILLLQEQINDEGDKTVNIRLLVPTKVIGCLIGKNGSIVNDMRKRTKAEIRISKGEKPKCASSSDELVEVTGEVGNLRDALLQITLRLREDVLKERDGTGKTNAPSIDSVYSGGLSGPPILPSVPSAASLGYDQRVETGGSFGMVPASSLYGYGALQAGEKGYGSLSSYSSKAYGGGMTPFTEVVIPSHAVSKVVGRGGTNLANIRSLSGADVELVDSKSSRHERIARISGNPEQKRAAENMIQAFILAT